MLIDGDARIIFDFITCYVKQSIHESHSRGRSKTCLRIKNTISSRNPELSPSLLSARWLAHSPAPALLYSNTWPPLTHWHFTLKSQFRPPRSYKLNCIAALDWRLHTRSLRGRSNVIKLARFYFTSELYFMGN